MLFLYSCHWHIGAAVIVIVIVVAVIVCYNNHLNIEIQVFIILKELNIPPPVNKLLPYGDRMYHSGFLVVIQYLPIGIGGIIYSLIC